MINTAVGKIKHAVTAYTYSDPISERTARNRRNALIISGLSLLHFWNPIELTGLGFRLKDSDANSITIILFALLSYLAFTLILNSISDLLESIEKINSEDVDETRKNWSIAIEWAQSLKGIEGDGPYRDPTLDSTKANIKALHDRIPEVIELEDQHRKSVGKAKLARTARTVIGDIVLPGLIIIGAFTTHIVTFLRCGPVT